jgi:hypothetical protein
MAEKHNSSCLPSYTEENRDYALHKCWAENGLDLTAAPLFLLFALGGLLWLRRFDERNFPHHVVEARRLALWLRFHRSKF